MATWDVTKPADTDLVRNAPTLFRADKATLQTDLQVEHDVLATAGGSTGRHKFPSGNTAGRPANPVTGSIYFNTQTGQVEQWTGAAWVGRTDFPSGTVMLFKQATAPVSWTRQVDAGNTDAVIIQRTNGEAPGAGGAWVISGGSVSAHVLTIAEMPSHTHPVTLFESGGSPGGGIRIGTVTDLGPIGVTNATGGGSGHVHPFAHDGAWRPKHVDVIVATKA